MINDKTYTRVSKSLKRHRGTEVNIVVIYECRESRRGRININFKKILKQNVTNLKLLNSSNLRFLKIDF